MSSRVFFVIILGVSLFSGQAAFGAYCTASGGCDDEIEGSLNIDGVEVGDISNTGTGCDGYFDYTALSTTMEIGQGYAITVTNGDPYDSDDQCAIWVDWNQDEDFYDADEAISVSGGNEIFTATITPPEGAALGDTRMRIRIMWTGTPSPCAYSTWGEVEDYTITVAEAGPSTISISGCVKTAEGIRVKGATVSASTGPNTVTNALGEYTLILSSPFNGTTQPSQLDWTFDARLYIGQTTDLEDEDFTGTYDVSYGGGDGTSSSPYLIYNAAQLNAVGARASDWDYCFRLAATIDLSGYDGLDGRPSFNRIGCYINNGVDHIPFTGVFDGAGHTIFNFTFDSNCGNDGVGMFGYVSTGGVEIKDIKLTNVDVNSTSSIGTGALVGRMADGTVSGCFVQTGTVSGEGSTGGLVGRSLRGVITDCNAEVGVSGDEGVGGLLGSGSGIIGTISDCHASCVVTGRKNCGGLIGSISSDGVSAVICSSSGSVAVTEMSAGGLVGENQGVIEYCYSTADVTGAGADEIGGLVGRNLDTISNSYAMGSAYGSSKTGGLAGLTGGGITNCYSTGLSNDGGLIGYRMSGAITGSFWDVNTSGQSSSDGGTGKTTAEMQTETTFISAGWDFINETANGEEDIWYINSGDYPRLWWEGGAEYEIGCEFIWRSGDGMPGMWGQVWALTEWDPDGAGPQQELLVAGGRFSFAGETWANNIAAWDGNSWYALGSGVNGDIAALAVYDGKLIAGGNFSKAGGVDVNSIAAWDGNSWEPLGGGIYGLVYSFTIYDSKLIVGGLFHTAGSVDANYIASWDGSNWQPIGGGTSSIVAALTVYDGDLIAAGYFGQAGGVDVNRIGRWNGTTWQSLDSGVNSAILDLTVYDGELIAGGFFNEASGVDANRVARWNGTVWNNLGDGVDSTVGSLCVYDGNLIVGGGFEVAGSCDAVGIAQWNGSDWQAMGGGLIYPDVEVLTTYAGELIAGGGFVIAGDVGADCIARWDGNAWHSLADGANYIIESFTVYDESLIFGGLFYSIGDIQTKCIAQWDGENWLNLGQGVNSQVGALAVFEGDLIAGGYFTEASGIDANRVARWDGSSWHALGTGIGGADSPFVYSLSVYDGNLIAGGYFDTAGGISADNIAQWNGSAWETLGSGTNGVVYAMTVYDGNLIAGGSFTTAGGTNAKRIALWNGSSWEPLGSGMSDTVKALTVYNDELIAAGEFATAGGISASRIAAWDGNDWRRLGTGAGGGDIGAVTVYNGEIFIAGSFNTAGGVDANQIARWDGSDWHALGDGLGDSPSPFFNYYALTVYDGDLVLGGRFSTVDGKISAFWARWGVPEVIEGDLNHDCAVDWFDMGLFVERWLDDDCLYNGWCYEADLNYDTQVDFLDYSKLAASWLEGLEEQ